MTEKIWVIGRDYGLEGKAKPDMAFRSKEKAEEAKRLCEGPHQATAMYLAEVPMWKDD